MSDIVLFCRNMQGIDTMAMVSLQQELSDSNEHSRDGYGRHDTSILIIITIGLVCTLIIVLTGWISLGTIIIIIFLILVLGWIGVWSRTIGIATWGTVTSSSQILDVAQDSLAAILATKYIGTHHFLIKATCFTLDQRACLCRGLGRIFKGCKDRWDLRFKVL